MEMSEIYNGSQWAHDIFLVNKAGATEYTTGQSSTLVIIKMSEVILSDHLKLGWTLVYKIKVSDICNWEIVSLYYKIIWSSSNTVWSIIITKIPFQFNLDILFKESRNNPSLL